MTKKMMDDKRERNADKPKGFLTYPINRKSNGTTDTRSLKIEYALLEKRTVKRYIAKFDDKKIKDRYVGQTFAGILTEMGVKINEIEEESSLGKKKLIISVNGKMIEIPVEISKLGYRIEGYEIQIRVTADTPELLMLYIRGIENMLQEWCPVPKKCIWIQSAVEEKSIIKSETDKENAIKKEVDRLKNKVEDLEDQVNGQRKTQLRNTMLEDYKVKTGVLR